MQLFKFFRVFKSMSDGTEADENSPKATTIKAAGTPKARA